MSRTCPECGESYPDDVFFCGVDGHIVIQDQPADDFDPRLGKQLGGYIVAARVADGAMGRVFEGRHPETKARVAIKVLHDHVAHDNVAVERFRREFETASEMDHPHIVKVLEFGETGDGSYFLTMEFLEGEELSKATAGGPLPMAQALRILCQSAGALQHAHTFGFIHRDLKPDNIFLCRTDEGPSVRILDFGSVKLQMETGAKLTAIGTTLGSPYYMSPEQAMGASDMDQRTDVFALTAILYEMLTSKVAFEGANVAMILMKIMNENPPAPSGLNADCPASLDDVIDKGLAKEKGSRYSDAPALASAALKAVGLEIDVDKWASVSLAELETALSTATPAAAKPFGAPPSAAPPASSPRVDPEPDPGSRPTADTVITVPTQGSGAKVALGIGLALVVVAIIFMIR